MSRPIGNLDRALISLGDPISSYVHRERQLGYTRSGEMEQQVKVMLGGKASDGWSFADGKVKFTYPFAWAPAQRLNPFRYPHFSYGVEMVITPGQPNENTLILVNAHVLQWVRTNSNHVVGAKIRYASSAPQAEGEEYDFSAVVHLKFQGYGVEIDEGETR